MADPFEYKTRLNNLVGWAAVVALIVVILILLVSLWGIGWLVYDVIFNSTAF